MKTNRITTTTQKNGTEKNNPSPQSLMRAIIISMRGGIIGKMSDRDIDYLPAVGTQSKICEPQLLERLLVFGYTPNNSTLCDAIRLLRQMLLQTPQKDEKGAFWLIVGLNLDGAKFEFKLRPTDFICGDKQGRHLAANQQEIKDYQDARVADAKNQMKNADAANAAFVHFDKNKPQLF